MNKRGFITHQSPYIKQIELENHKTIPVNVEFTQEGIVLLDEIVKSKKSKVHDLLILGITDNNSELLAIFF